MVESDLAYAYQRAVFLKTAIEEGNESVDERILLEYLDDIIKIIENDLKRRSVF